MPMSIPAREFLDLLVNALDYVSSSAALPLTGYCEKWRIVSETLLGHPRVRGARVPGTTLWDTGIPRTRPASRPLTPWKTCSRRATL